MVATKHLASVCASAAASARSTARAWLAQWLLLATAMLAGCGPGVGGSGTGETTDALGVFGASAVSICSGELATLLGCATPTGGGPAAVAAPGAAPVYLADTIDGRRVAVSVQGNLIELNAPCARIQFRGQWGAIAGQAGRFFGSAGPDLSATPATLQAAVRGNALELTLTDAQGSVLLGPVLVTVRPAPVAVGDCG